MKSNIKIIFMGTPEFSVPSLEAVTKNFEVVSVYSQPPKNSGRGLKKRISPIHSFAEKNNLCVKTPLNFSNPNTVNEIINQKADFIVVVAYGIILPPSVLNSPKYLCLNGHASDLPRWRGAAPIQRAIEAGDKTTAVSAMIMEETLDTGPVIIKKKIVINDNETSNTLHDTMSEEMPKVLIDAINLVHNKKHNPIKQDTNGVLYAKKISSSENESTQKFLFKTNDNHFIETVSMVEGNRHTICLSSQVGCNVDCTFCATGKMGIIRNLNSGEIVDQLNLIKKNVLNPITNVVFMGMGEPFLNYKNTIEAANLLHHPKGINLGAKRITISTAGIVPKIEQYAKELHPFKLAISLNGTSHEQRLKIMPITKAFSFKNLLKVAKNYAYNSRNKLTFEYVLLKDINDDIKDAKKLISLLERINCKLNIIPYNEIGGHFERPSDKKIEKFIKVLKNVCFPVTVRWSKGTDIDAGCGQLVTSIEA